MSVPGRRQRWWVASLALTLAACAWTYWRGERSAVVEAVPARSPRQASSDASAGGALLPEALVLVKRSGADASPSDPFAVKSWQPPPVPPPPPPPPPPPMAPMAPPLPFRYLGSQSAAGGPAAQAVYYLSRDKTVYAARSGDKLDSDYQFDGAVGGGNLQFIYLPLGTKQNLSIGDVR